MLPGEPNRPDPSAPDPGLPPVEPPSGRFLAQLFAVPGLIVLGVVLGLLAVFYLWKSAHTPEQFLLQLDSDNVDIRWRAASDLAQVLKRPERDSLKWRADAKFALDLAERLRTALDELDRSERATRDQLAKLKERQEVSSQEEEAAWRKLGQKRHYVSFLASALGDFHVPVGVPLLAEVCQRGDAPDPKGNTQQRRKALWSLANLGENTRSFKKLPSETQAEVLDVLRAQAAGAAPRAAWARTALYHLDPTALAPADRAGAVKVDEVLAKLAGSGDRYLREQVAVALNFWDGPLVEPTLLKLAADDGRGTLLRVTEID